MVQRPHYMAWLRRWRDRDVIKVLTGLRRCGKSTILALFRDELRAEGVADANIIDMNFERLDVSYPHDAQGLYDYVVERLAPGRNYVFLDEVQHVADFERAVDGLYVRDDVDLYVTGSNAYFLSGELATLLTGRQVELRVLPLSFAEYHSARADERPEDAFNRYLTYGGLPYTLQIESAQDMADYLGGVFSTIVVKDIAARSPRMDVRAFSRVASFLADNVGNLTSQQKVATGLASAGGKTARGEGASPTTVGGYIEALKENFLVFEAQRYDVKGKLLLSTLEKYYLGDLGFRFWLLGRSQGDVGHRIENAVYLELLRRYESVAVGTMRGGEIDFVAMREGAPHYFQVAMSVLDEATLAREMAPLRLVQDNYSKTLLTMDRVGVGEREGIRQENIVDWLLACP